MSARARERERDRVYKEEYDDGQKREGERERESIINVLSMINGFSVGITDWLCF